MNKKVITIAIALFGLQSFICARRSNTPTSSAANNQQTTSQASNLPDDNDWFEQFMASANQPISVETPQSTPTTLTPAQLGTQLGQLSDADFMTAFKTAMSARTAPALPAATGNVGAFSTTLQATTSKINTLAAGINNSPELASVIPSFQFELLQAAASL